MSDILEQCVGLMEAPAAIVCVVLVAEAYVGAVYVLAP